MKTERNIQLWSWMIILLFAIWNAFFNFQPLVELGIWRTIANMSLLIIVVYLYSCFLSQLKEFDISFVVSLILIMFSLSVIWSAVFWEQNVTDSIKALFTTNRGVYQLVVFIFLLKFGVNQHSVIKAIISLCILYSICMVIGQLTFPQQLFGAASIEMNEYAISSYEARGVLRLVVPGADFVVLCIFFVLSQNNKSKKYYYFLIPLFFILFLRGTRTPLFITLFISFVFFVFKTKHRFVSALIAIAVFLFLSESYDNFLQSRSDSVLVKYIQLTNNQIENNKIETDIRIEMADYMFTKFNGDNVGAILFGNGLPSENSAYQKQMDILSQSMHYYIDDSGFTNIFICFGVVGLSLYLLLFVQVIRTKVSPNCYFAKLYVYYLYLIMPTNAGILTLTPFTFGLALYIIYKDNHNTKFTDNRKRRILRVSQSVPQSLSK